MPDSTVLQFSVLLYWMCFFKVKSGYFLQGHHFHSQLTCIMNAQVTMAASASAKTGKATLVAATQKLFLAAAGEQFLSFCKKMRKTCW